MPHCASQAFWVTTRRRGETALPTHPCTCQCAVWRQAPERKKEITQMQQANQQQQGQSSALVVFMFLFMVFLCSQFVMFNSVFAYIVECIYIYIYTYVERERCICMYIHIYIYIEREREKERYVCMYIYIYIMYLFIYIVLVRTSPGQPSPPRSPPRSLRWRS